MFNQCLIIENMKTNYYVRRGKLDITHLIATSLKLHPDKLMDLFLKLLSKFEKRLSCLNDYSIFKDDAFRVG